MTQLFRTGATTFDPETLTLMRAGAVVPLDRNCRAIFALLATHPGTDISKDDLMQAGWPGRLVHENSLAKAIGRLRQALGADADALVSVYGYGYRLMPGADVAVDEPAITAGVIEQGARVPVAEPVRAERRWPTLLVAVFAVIVLAVGLWHGRTIASAMGLADPPIRDTPPIIHDAPDTIGRILWVDDHPSNNTLEKTFFERHRLAVHNALSTDEALKLLALNTYGLVISDMGRGDDRLAGLKLAAAMHQRGLHTPLMIYTVRAKTPAQQEAQRAMVAEAGVAYLVLNPHEVRAAGLRVFGNPQPR